MKLSVSVPDDLWNEARSLTEQSATSGVVQEALRRWVAQMREGPRYAINPPDGVHDAMEQTRDRLTREARARFELGYVQGVECGRRLPWCAIEDLADHHRFDVAEWARTWATEAVVLDMECAPANKSQGERVIEVRVGTRRSRRGRPFNWPPVDAIVQTDSVEPDPYLVVRALVPALGALVPTYGNDIYFDPGPTYLRGFTQAMRDLWSSVAEGTAGTGE